MKKSSLSLVAAVIFMLVTMGGYYWLWTISKTESAVVSTATADFTIVEIESVKKEATTILSGLENKASIPIIVPTDKMGRANPFADY